MSNIHHIDVSSDSDSQTALSETLGDQGRDCDYIKLKDTSRSHQIHSRAATTRLIALDSSPAPSRFSDIEIGHAGEEEQLPSEDAFLYYSPVTNPSRTYYDCDGLPPPVDLGLPQSVHCTCLLFVSWLAFNTIFSGSASGPSNPKVASSSIPQPQSVRSATHSGLSEDELVILSPKKSKGSQNTTKSCSARLSTRDNLSTLLQRGRHEAAQSKSSSNDEREQLLAQLNFSDPLSPFEHPRSDYSPQASTSRVTISLDSDSDSDSKITSNSTKANKVTARSMAELLGRPPIEQDALGPTRHSCSRLKGKEKARVELHLGEDDSGEVNSTTDEASYDTGDQDVLHGPGMLAAMSPGKREMSEFEWPL